jgi:hypothetical protein
MSPPLPYWHGIYWTERPLDSALRGRSYVHSAFGMATVRIRCLVAPGDQASFSCVRTCPGSETRLDGNM